MIARAMMVMAAAICLAGCDTEPQGSMRELQRTRAGALDVVLLAPQDALQRGKGFAILEFHDSSGNLVNVGAVNVSASMPHPGTEPMRGGSEVKPTPAPGRYEIVTDFSMAGTWDLAIEWDGPSGRGTARLPGTVR
jgi:hypothetical protein